MSISFLDPAQVLRGAYDEANISLRVRQTSGSLVNAPFDNISLSYITVGNGSGSLGTVQYYLGVDLVAELTLVYDASNRLISVQKT